MKVTGSLIEAVAKQLFDRSPVSRGAKSWEDLDDAGPYKRSFRSEAMSVLQLIEDFEK